MTTSNEFGSNVGEDDNLESIASIVGDDRDDTVVIGKKVLPKLNWVWLNYQGDGHDSRRILDHRAKNCHCEVCYRELNKLPPDDPVREKYVARKHKEEEREKRRVKRKAKKDVKAGKQASIRNFFRY